MRTILLAVLFASTLSHAQTKQGNWECSASAMAGSLSRSDEVRQGDVLLGTSESSAGYATLALRAGYFVVDRLSVEPEVFVDAVEKWNPAYILSANVTYNYPLEDIRLTPFALVGYGRGNAVPQLLSVPLVIVRFTDGFSIPVLQFGAGGKYMIGDHAALRLEYRYQHFSYDQSFGAGVTTSTSMHYSNLLLGVSVFIY